MTSNGTPSPAPRPAPSAIAEIFEEGLVVAVDINPEDVVKLLGPLETETVGVVAVVAFVVLAEFVVDTEVSPFCPTVTFPLSHCQVPRF